MGAKLLCFVTLALCAILSASCGRPTSSFRHLRGLAPAAPTVPTSLWDLISNSSDLSTVKQLVQAAGLVKQLSNTTVLQTMFMPSNAAFASYCNETSRNVSDLTNFTGLSELLLYHLHIGSVIQEDDINRNTTINMAAAGNVSASLRLPWDDSFALRDNAGRTAGFRAADQPAGPNAIAHIIDRVLVPTRPSTVEEALSANSRFSTFLALMTSAGYSATLSSNNTNMTFLIPTNQAMANALVTMNTTLSALLSNHSLVQSIVSAHIVPSVETWATLNNDSGTRYFFTCNSCASFYTSEQGDGLSLEGAGNAVDQSATIVESDLIAGRFALLQVLDSALLPLAKWVIKCKFTGQSPADGSKSSSPP